MGKSDLSKIPSSDLVHELTLIVRERVLNNDQVSKQIAEAIADGLRHRLGDRDFFIMAEDRSGTGKSR